jgi:hypothetical protein
LATYFVNVDYFTRPDLRGATITQNVLFSDTIRIQFRGIGPEELVFGSAVNCNGIRLGNSTFYPGGRQFRVDRFRGSAYSIQFVDDEGDRWTLLGSVGYVSNEVFPQYPDVIPDPTLIPNFDNSNVSLTLSPVASDNLDAYSISRGYNPSPTNAWVVANRISPTNGPGYVTGSIFVMPSFALPPSPNGSYPYFIYSYRFPAGGGAGQYYYANVFTITRGLQDIGISSGTISLADLQNFFGGSNPAELSEYYRGRGRVPNISQNNAIPTAGTISLSNFYNSKNN